MEVISEILGPASAILVKTIQSASDATPRVIAALLILAIGWIIAKIAQVIVSKTLNRMKVDEYIEEQGYKKAIFGLSVTGIASKIVEWYILLVFFKDAASYVQLKALADFFGAVILWIPEAVVGTIIMLLSLIFGQWVKERIEKSELAFSDIISNAIYALIIYFALVISLPHFGVTNTAILERVFEIFIAGIAAGIAIAIGIGFGLTIKDTIAPEIIKNYTKKRK